MKIAIDAGHGGTDLGSLYKERQEKMDNLNLALAVGEKLERAGHEVYYTRTEDTYDSPIEKARLANDANADLLISLHRNNSITPNTYTGAEAFLRSSGGQKAKIAESILNNLSDVGFVNLGVNTMANDVLLKRTQMPAILFEIGFINTDEDNELFDTKLDEIATAIADAITSHIEEMNDSYQRTYRVQVGGINNESVAQRLAYHLFLDGYEAIIKQRDDNLYVVLVGEIFVLDQAVMLEQFLRVLGYNTFIITEENERNS